MTGRYEVRNGVTMWGPRLIVFDLIAGAKATFGDAGRFAWRRTKAGRAEAEATVAALNADLCYCGTCDPDSVLCQAGHGCDKKEDK